MQSAKSRALMLFMARTWQRTVALHPLMPVGRTQIRLKKTQSKASPRLTRALHRHNWGILAGFMALIAQLGYEAARGFGGSAYHWAFHVMSLANGAGPYWRVPST